MTDATLDVSRSNIVIILAASLAEMSCNASASTVCMASQNLRWSSTFSLILVNRSPAVPAHQSANAFFDRGATSLPTERQVPGPFRDHPGLRPVHRGADVRGRPQISLGHHLRFAVHPADSSATVTVVASSAAVLVSIR